MLASAHESATRLAPPRDLDADGVGSRQNGIRWLLLLAVLGGIATAVTTLLPWSRTHHPATPATDAWSSYVTGWSSEFGPLFVLCCLSIVAGAVVALAHASKPEIPPYLMAIVGVPAGILFVVSLTTLNRFVDTTGDFSTLQPGLWLFLVATLATAAVVVTTLPRLLKRRPPR
jgi:hypothetical protein